MVIVNCKSPPVGMGYAVVALVDDGWKGLGMIACPPKENRRFRLNCPVRGTSKRPVSVVFYPTVAAAAASVDTCEIWSGPLNDHVPGQP